MKDQDLSCEELYNAYDFNEKQQRKWLVKIAKYWLKNIISKKISKIVTDVLEVVERYIRGEATQKELEDAHANAYDAYTAYTDYDNFHAAAYAYDVSCATFDEIARTSAAAAHYTRPIIKGTKNCLYPDVAYKEALLEVINEMDELERIIRRKI